MGDPLTGIKPGNLTVLIGKPTPRPPFIPPDSTNWEGRLAWLYHCESGSNLSPHEETEIRMLERQLFGTSRWDESLERMRKGMR